MNRLRVELLGVGWLLGLLLGCGAGYLSDFGCHDDSECENTQVCSRNQCEDPDKNLVVEITPNAKEGLFAQDVELPELRDHLTLELGGPSTIQGQVLVRGGGTTPSGYASRVTLRVTGESLLLPGVPRLQEDSTVSLGSGGNYSLAVGSGRYTVKLFTSDTELPPLSGYRDVMPGGTALLDFLLPSPADVVRLSSQVLRFDGLPPSRDLPLEVQIVDANLLPLTQRATVGPESGLFSLSLLRADLTTPGLSLLVTSKNPLMPQVRFPLGTALPSGPFLLADYGAPVTLRGRVVDAQGVAVAGATLSLSGQVEGGGIYRGSPVQSRADGQFELLTLPSAMTGPTRELRLAIIPPASSSAGSTEQSVIVPRVSVFELGNVPCQERRKVSGTVLNPEEQPAAGVQVEANLLQELKNVPRPSTSRVVAPRRTDDMGHYSLTLDPGVYRFDFISVDNLPRFSRIVTVRPDLPATSTQDVSVSLPRGRRITGSVRLTGEPSARMFAPNAGLRFFRQVPVDGQPSALLLGETTTDSQGAFSTTLPLP